MTFADDVIHQPARVQFEVFLDEHRAQLNGCLDGLSEEQVRRSLVPSRTTLLGLVKHATSVEKVWCDEAVTCRSRAEIGIPATPDESYIIDDYDTVATIQRALAGALQNDTTGTSFLQTSTTADMPGSSPGLSSTWRCCLSGRTLGGAAAVADVFSRRITMAGNEPYGFDPEDLDRLVRGAGEQLRGALGQFGKLFDSSGERAGWSRTFDDATHLRRPTPEPETTGQTGDGVWVIYAVNGDGGTQIEQVYATELDALRANKNNTDTSRKVRFLPYGIPASVLDEPKESPNN